jgi:hypothetical protein
MLTVTAQTCIPERLRHLSQVAVGGQRNVSSRRSWYEAGQLADESITPLRGRGSPPVMRTFWIKPGGAGHAKIVGKCEIAVGAPSFPSAVNTPIVAVIGDGDPQIGDGAPEFVGEKHSALSIQHSAKHG